MIEYGEFIWPAYLVVFGFLIAMGFGSYRNQKKLETEVNTLKELHRSGLEKEE